MQLRWPLLSLHPSEHRAVEVVCKEGPARVLELVQMGASFTLNPDGSLHLTKEGGHSSRRIVHAADMTGREIERALLAAARAHPNIHFQVLGLDAVSGPPGATEGGPHVCSDVLRVVAAHPPNAQGLCSCSAWRSLPYNHPLV